MSADRAVGAVAPLPNVLGWDGMRLVAKIAKDLIGDTGWGERADIDQRLVT